MILVIVGRPSGTSWIYDGKSVFTPINNTINILTTTLYNTDTRVFDWDIRTINTNYSTSKLIVYCKFIDASYTKGRFKVYRFY